MTLQDPKRLKGSPWPQALLAIEELRASAAPRSTIRHNMVLNSCAKAQKWRHCLQLQHESGFGNLVSQSTVIAAEAQVNRWCNALERLACLGSRRLQSNAVATTAAAHAIGGATWPLAAVLLAAQQGDVGAQNAKMALWADGTWSQALEVYDSLTQRRLTPDPTSTSTAIMAAAEGLIWTSALHLLQELWILELRCTTILLNSAITACGRCAQWAMALAIFADHFTESLERSNATYTTLIGACEMGGRWELALEVLALSRSEQRCTNVTFNAALGACGQCARWQVALQLMEDTVKASFPCDTIAHNTAMAAFAKAGRWQHALWLLSLTSGGADVISYATVARTCAAESAWRIAAAVLAVGRRAQVEMDVVAHGGVLDACAGRWAVAGEILAEMYKEGLHPTVRSYSAALAAGRVPWKFAMKLVDQLRARKMQLPAVVCDAAMVACESSGELDHLWLLLVSSERSPSAFLWGLALLGTSEAEVIQEACGRALVHLRRDRSQISCNELASLWSSGSALGAVNPNFQRCLAELTAEMEGFSLEELVTAVWGVGSVPSPESAGILVAAQWRVLDILRGLLDTRRVESLMMTRDGLHVLGVMLACYLAGCLSQQFRRFLRHTFLHVGRARDAARPGRPGQPGTLEKASWSPSPSPQDSKPVLVMRDSDRAVLLKPAGWEVYGQHTKRQLSSFAADVLGSRPIFEDPGHYHGFLHRLDVPSSGLILVAASYEAYYDLQVQLHSGQVQRDYAVLHHGRLPVSVNQVDSRLLWHGDGPTLAGGRGKPSRTLVALQWYAESEVGSVSQSHLQICTGRKHQIRSHLAHIGHPVLRDGAYGNESSWPGTFRKAGVTANNPIADQELKSDCEFRPCTALLLRRQASSPLVAMRRFVLGIGCIGTVWLSETERLASARSS
ncbi:unnamed protein product, partial [Symbiodinium sp. CCMP2456]